MKLRLLIFLKNKLIYLRNKAHCDYTNLKHYYPPSIVGVGDFVYWYQCECEYAGETLVCLFVCLFVFYFFLKNVILRFSLFIVKD